MTLQIRSLSGILTEDEKRTIRRALLPLEKFVPNNAVFTVGVRGHITKKSNQAYEIVAHLIVPGRKRPIYSKIYRQSLEEAVNKAREKIERQLIKTKDKRYLRLKELFGRLNFVSGRRKNGTT
jgi:ribosome-associated translation inhibitor RaiA